MQMFFDNNESSDNFEYCIFYNYTLDPKPDCDYGDLKCTKPNEAVKCYKEFPPCYQTTCESALRPRIICNFLVAPQVEPNCGCKPGYYYNKAGKCVTLAQCKKEQGGKQVTYLGV